MKMSKAQLLRSTLLVALAVPGMALPAFAQETTGPAAQPTVRAGSRLSQESVRTWPSLAVVARRSLS